MRTIVRIIVLASAVSLTLTSAGHTCAETNSLIKSMLSPLLVCTRLQGDRIVASPHAVALQSDFFVGDASWTSAEKREVFDWYLNNLNFTASKALSGTPFDDGRRNALAEAAIRQCAAMSYTNALPAVEAYAVGDDMPARMESMELVFMWHGMDEWLVTFANGIVTNSAKYSARERNLAGRKFCGRLISSLQEGATNSPAWNAGVQAMYGNRTNVACAVAIDAMLVDCMPGYAAGSDRRLCADLIAANTNAWENCRAYFENVVNTMPMSSMGAWSHEVRKEVFSDRIRDWGLETGRGFYPEDFSIRDVFETLLMYGYKRELSLDIPSGTVHGLFEWSRNVLERKNVKVGAGDIKINMED